MTSDEAEEDVTPAVSQESVTSDQMDVQATDEEEFVPSDIQQDISAVAGIALVNTIAVEQEWAADVLQKVRIYLQEGIAYDMVEVLVEMLDRITYIGTDSAVMLQESVLHEMIAHKLIQLRDNQLELTARGNELWLLLHSPDNGESTTGIEVDQNFTCLHHDDLHEIDLLAIESELPVEGIDLVGSHASDRDVVTEDDEQITTEMPDKAVWTKRTVRQVMDIPGMTDDLGQVLLEHGILTMDDLAVMEPQRIGKILDIRHETAIRLINTAIMFANDVRMDNFVRRRIEEMEILQEQEQNDRQRSRRVS